VHFHWYHNTEIEHVSAINRTDHTKSEDQLPNKTDETEDYASQTNSKYSVQEETTEEAQNHIRPRAPE